MKKVLIAVLILLLLGGAGAGYYFFFMQKDEPEKPVAAKTEKAPVDKGDASKPIMDLEAPAPEIWNITLSSVALTFTTSLMISL